MEYGYEHLTERLIICTREGSQEELQFLIQQWYIFIESLGYEDSDYPIILL